MILSDTYALALSLQRLCSYLHSFMPVVYTHIIIQSCKFDLLYTGSGLAHAQDMSDRVSLSPRSSPARDAYWSVPTAALLSPPSMPLTDTKEERQIAEIAVVGELTSDTNTGKREVMDLATGIQNQLSADDEIEVHEPQDATSSHLQESSISPSKHASLPLEVKSKIVPGMFLM